ncbi:hypothetical protein HYO65_gp090 [Tenacibaculum phage PTm1]|uniref:Uncharacterized protein n=2 Tax=Shirahamavirus PTm1 TaxID=2846435 RepID=A0A5S9EQI9_9CAUD|nr:hypothetical protein HYO65_gp090 [Tenacibaculum phage PTm1]BBI90482.1 hypothetical protein [Tenacibaculum phage PTm1]BBI90790.1 hypothetical protein [Tenacibaculum phage PTm5]
MLTVELGNIGCEKQAKKIKEKLQGKTYFNFEVDYCAYMGNYPVSVSSDINNNNSGNEYTLEEFKYMLMFVMACEM